MLAQERDRLADERDGLTIAQEAACSPATLLAMLVPGLGPLIVMTARATCAAMDVAEIPSRIARLDDLIAKLEAVAVDVFEAPSDRLDEVERAVLAIVNATADVSAVSDVFDDTAQTVVDIANDFRTVLPSLPAMGWGIGAALGGAALLLFAMR